MDDPHLDMKGEAEAKRWAYGGKRRPSSVGQGRVGKAWLGMGPLTHFWARESCARGMERHWVEGGRVEGRRRRGREVSVVEIIREPLIPHSHSLTQHNRTTARRRCGNSMTITFTSKRRAFDLP